MVKKKEKTEIGPKAEDGAAGGSRVSSKREKKTQWGIRSQSERAVWGGGESVRQKNWKRKEMRSENAQSSAHRLKIKKHSRSLRFQGWSIVGVLKSSIVKRDLGSLPLRGNCLEKKKTLTSSRVDASFIGGRREVKVGKEMRKAHPRRGFSLDPRFKVDYFLGSGNEGKERNQRGQERLNGRLQKETKKSRGSNPWKGYLEIPGIRGGKF